MKPEDLPGYEAHSIGIAILTYEQPQTVLIALSLSSFCDISPLSSEATVKRAFFVPALKRLPLSSLNPLSVATRIYHV